MGMFRELKAEEIECRVSRCNNWGVDLLLYKTARVDADILDETIGSDNWQCRFYEHKGTMFCSLGIRIQREDGTTEWVWKDDAGSPSNMESVKGEASDAFKRAAFKWGIGRSLYTAPSIFVHANKLKNHQQGKNGKWQCYDEFRVARIAIEDGRITGVRVVNADTGMVVFSWKEPDNG